MTKYYVGIDPGKTGGIAMIDEYGVIVDCNPVFTKKNPEGKGNIYDITALRKHYEFIQARSFNDVTICIEKQQSYPRDTPMTAFKVGEGYGILRSVFKLHELVHPRTWQAHFKYKDFPGEKKERSFQLVDQIYGDYAKQHVVTIRGRKLDGIADALIIAEYARQNNE